MQRSQDTARRGRRARIARALVCAVLAGLMILAQESSARAAELVMFESPSCTWCQQWHEEVGPAYAKTDEAARVPLRRVNLHGDWPEDLKGIRGVTFTPTFVLVEDGEELDRITGYAGADMFWFQLATLMNALKDTGGEGDAGNGS
jgi:protein-disulfide isomerase